MDLYCYYFGVRVVWFFLFCCFFPFSRGNGSWVCDVGLPIVEVSNGERVGCEGAFLLVGNMVGWITMTIFRSCVGWEGLRGVERGLEGVCMGVFHMSCTPRQ